MTISKFAIGIILTGTLLSSCGEKKQETGEELKENAKEEMKEQVSENIGTPGKLDGAWEIKRAEGSMADMNIGTVYEFRGNKLSFGQGSFTNPGSTEITDTTFSFQAEGNEYKFMYDYHFNGDTLVVKMQKSDQTFHLVKK